jgi:hypothetical protein
MWRILRFLLVLILPINCALCEVVDAEVIDAVAPDINTEPAIVFDSDRAGIEPIKYDGAQLWRIAYNDQQYKNAVAELQKQFKVSMWNLQMNNQSKSHVDMFVKSAMVNDARDFLTKVRVPFEVVINDVQEAIDTENPPLDDVEKWQNRDGELFES